MGLGYDDWGVISIFSGSVWIHRVVTIRWLYDSMLPSMNLELGGASPGMISCDHHHEMCRKLILFEGHHGTARKLPQFVTSLPIGNGKMWGVTQGLVGVGSTSMLPSSLKKRSLGKKLPDDPMGSSQEDWSHITDHEHGWTNKPPESTQYK